MTYCTLEDVKPGVGVPQDDSTYDQEISQTILEAQAIVDTILKTLIGELPFDESNVPDIVRYACADIAAGLFRMRRSPGQRDIFLTLGLDKLSTYAAGFRRVVKA